MTWTYDDTESTPKDQVRGTIGDTDTTDQQFSDEAINAKITTQNSTYGAALECINTLIGRYSRSVTRSVGRKSSSNLSDIVIHYRQLRADLQLQMLGSSSVTGSFISGDRDPLFTRDMQIADPSENKTEIPEIEAEQEQNLEIDRPG